MGRIKYAEGESTGSASASGNDGAVFNTTSGTGSGADSLRLQAGLISATYPNASPFSGILFSLCVISVSVSFIN